MSEHFAHQVPVNEPVPTEAQMGATAEPAAIERKTYSSPRLTEHGRVIQRTGQPADFSGPAG
jgi:hypothetical protein